MTREQPQIALESEHTAVARNSMAAGFVWGATQSLVNGDLIERPLTTLVYASFKGTLYAVAAAYVSTIVPHPFTWAVPIALYVSSGVAVAGAILAAPIAVETVAAVVPQTN